MHRIVINKLGPISYCELKCSDFLTFTGFQASGKSTIAKAIYFFRTVKEDILNISVKQAVDAYQSEKSLRRRLEAVLREKFLRIFGSSWGMENDMFLEYFYTDSVYIKVMLMKETVYSMPNYVWIELSDEIKSFLRMHNRFLKAESTGIPEMAKEAFKRDLNNFFDDKFSVVYIPAGRSMITLLSNQLSYIYSTMEDSQKRALDYCTQDYLERILRLKTEFEYGIRGLQSRGGGKKSQEAVKRAIQLIDNILCGTYQCNNGEERIMLDNERYVKINFSSSGQQEAVWILNLLFYYLVKNEPILFIIEEPESHLFPEAQKYITELIGLVFNQGNSMLVTIHSPYVLGALNNLLYANRISLIDASKVDEVISKMLWLQGEKFSAWFVKDGKIENCIDEEIEMIQNQKIDEISKVINSDFDKIFDIQINNG